MAEALKGYKYLGMSYSGLGTAYINKAGTGIITVQRSVKKEENCKGTKLTCMSSLLDVAQGALRQEHIRKLPMSLPGNFNLLCYQSDIF